ncbi:MAG: dihydrolipoyl dehydrogenase [Proteobacteria bacterium]|nr:dihydrolipoyl dehydrogenase [Pseudomonadota bacterium]
MQNFDVVVIGAGPGGYVAAIRASQLGKKVAVIEKEHLGGVCLNWGCIPTKALLRSAEVLHLINHASEFGIEVGSVKFDLAKMVERSRKIASQLSTGIKGLLAKNKVTIFNGEARFENATTLKISGEKPETLIAKNIIIATGARARMLPGVESHPRVWTAKQAMTPEFTPKSLLVIGSGAIGIEFASFYRTLGVEVAVIEMQSKILPNEDAEISTLAQKQFEKSGIKFHLGSTCALTPNKDGVATIISKDGKEVEKLKVDAVIVAIGIVGNTENLGLEKTKVKTDKGQILNDQWCETSEKGVYAIGDVAGAPWLAHKASHEAILVAEHIAGVKNLHSLKNTDIPGCTYSHPQIASIGLTEEKAKAEGIALKVGRFPYRANGKAIALGETEGLVKTIFNAKTGELIGAHMIGAEVTELIQGFAIGKTLETTEEELMKTIFPHPTLSEMMHEATLDAYGRVIHS